VNDASSNVLIVPAARLSLSARAAIVALLLVSEKVLLNVLVDSDSVPAQGMGAWVHEAQHLAFRFLVSLALVLVLFCYVRARAPLAAVDAAARAQRIRGFWLLVHAVLLLPLAWLSYSLYGGHGLVLPFDAMAALWLLFACGAVLAAGAAMARWSLWRGAAHALGNLWFYAAAAALAATGALQWSQKLWAPTARITFDLVRWALIPWIPTLQADPSTLILSSSHFAVQVSEVCSGLEGVGLMLAFCCAWLLYFRHEYRFPRALLLIPAATLLIFALNVVRIAALMLIGDAGHTDIAVYGFHSQAGWIAFNLAACGIIYVSQRSGVLNRIGPSAPAATARPAASASDNPTAAYLLPFLTVLTVGIMLRASSSGFETLYVLRLLAGAAVLVLNWPRLSRLDWRFSWRAPAAGAAVFVVWALAAKLLTATTSIPAALAAMPAAARTLWIIARVAAAVITVPIVEELAYRGYLLRRLRLADFESVPFEAVGISALVISAIVFGLAHGTLWLPGIVAGLVYGWLLMRTGRIGEAVAAHATSNALLAAWVLLGNQWQLW
jgi:exosortase E/protease (VPEID-CTERM system)